MTGNRVEAASSLPCPVHCSDVRPAFRCPHCRGPLTEGAGASRCESGHSFDRAKEGYVNLLPAGRIRGRASGDDGAMVRARREVFDAGLYQPIIDRVATAAAEAAPSFLLDAGCGEGTYLAAATSAAGVQGWGVDISKPAVRLAARRNPEHHYAVASSYQLPFADGSFDVVLNVFSPRDFTEMRRVLRLSGVAIVVTPGPDHLHELKAAVYDDARRHGSDHNGHDRPQREEEVGFEVSLADPLLRSALLQMTPFWWSATPRRRQDVAANLFSVTVDMRLGIYSNMG